MRQVRHGALVLLEAQGQSLTAVEIIVVAAKIVSTSTVAVTGTANTVSQSFYMNGLTSGLTHWEW